MRKIFQFVSTNILSGLENVVINICTLVPGYKFTYVSPKGPIDEYLKQYHIPHITVSRITPISVRNVIKEYKPDIVHGHDVKASISLSMNYFLCKRNNIKIISELHNDDPRMWRLSLRSILYALSSYAYNQIVVISKPVIDNYIFKNYIYNKTFVINNIVNVYRIKKQLNQIIPHKNIVYKWDCIFLGRFVNQKDPLKFIKIIYQLSKKYNNIKAVMVGDGPLYKDVRDYIHKLNLNKNIVMVGFKKNPYKYLDKSKILVMPSKYEGFGLVAVESLLFGIPVVCSHTGGLINIVNNTCGYFATNIQEYMVYISKLLDNDKLYKYKSFNSIKRAKAINNISKFVSGYKNIYSK